MDIEFKGKPKVSAEFTTEFNIFMDKVRTWVKPSIIPTYAEYVVVKVVLNAVCRHHGIEYARQIAKIVMEEIELDEAKQRDS